MDDQTRPAVCPFAWGLRPDAFVFVLLVINVAFMVGYVYVSCVKLSACIKHTCTCGHSAQ